MLPLRQSFLASTLAAAALLVFVVDVQATPREDAAEADRRFAAGVRLLQQGNVGGALTEFEASRALHETASVVFNIAGCYRTLGRRIEARQAYRHVIGVSQSAAQRRAAERALEQVEAQLTLVTIRVEPTDAEISLDGRAVSAQPVAIEPGTSHDVEVRRAGHRTVRHRLEPAAAGPTELVLVLQHEVAPPSVAPAPSPAQVPPAPRVAERPVPIVPRPAAARTTPANAGTEPRRPAARESSGSAWPWILGGVGVAVVGAVVVGVAVSTSGGPNLEGDQEFFDVP